MVQETWSRSLVVPLTSSFCMKNNSFFRTNSPIYFWNFFYPVNNWSPDLPNVVASIGCRTYISQVLTPFLDQFLISQGSKTFIFQVWLLRLQFFYHNSIFLNNPFSASVQGGEHGRGGQDGHGGRPLQGKRQIFSIHFSGAGSVICLDPFFKDPDPYQRYGLDLDL